MAKSEKAVSEMLIAPVLSVVKENNADKIALFSGESLNTGPNSYLNVKFTDGALVLLRPNTRFEIEQYAYGAASPVAVAQSGARAVSSAPKGPQISKMPDCTTFHCTGRLAPSPAK